MGRNHEPSAGRAISATYERERTEWMAAARKALGWQQGQSCCPECGWSPTMVDADLYEEHDRRHAIVHVLAEMENVALMCPQLAQLDLSGVHAPVATAITAWRKMQQYGRACALFYLRDYGGDARTVLAAVRALDWERALLRGT